MDRLSRRYSNVVTSKTTQAPAAMVVATMVIAKGGAAMRTR
jgi:hypothetical protein